ncbi:MAG: FBP domain-containing protein [Chloroflexota bacterium]
MFLAEQVFDQINTVIKKKKIRIPGLQLTDEGILYALYQAGLSAEQIDHLGSVLNAYEQGQAVYGSHFHSALLFRLVESFLVFARSAVHTQTNTEPMDLLARNTNEQIFMRNLAAAEEPLNIFLGILKPDQIASLFNWKTKRGKERAAVLPESVENGDYHPFTHITWTVDRKMYMVTKQDNKLMGLQMSYSALKVRPGVPRMGLCDFCHGQFKLHETASITARVPTSKLPPYQSYKSVGRYVCIDHVSCNKKLYKTGKHDRVARFIESVNQNTPLIL